MGDSTRCHYYCLMIGLLVVFGKTEAQSQDDEGCRTPDGQEGSCVIIKNCQPFVDLLANIKRPFSQEVKERLKKYTCGYDTSSVKVCCSQGPISLDSQTVQLNDMPPDVSKHRNYRLLPQDCGYVDSTDRIVNGENAKLNEFPWMALLGYRNAKGIIQYKCGGSILNKNYILTAAHCIRTASSPLWTVRVGEHNLASERDCEKNNENRTICSPPTQDLAILEIIPHSQFDSKKLNNDIGLIRVSTIDLLRENVKPICMPVYSNTDLSDKHVVVAGWGKTQFDVNLGSDILQKAELPVVPFSSCRNMYRPYSVELNNRQMCAGGGSKDTCGGDSGGPLKYPEYINDEVRFVQHGIVSFGPTHCGKGLVPGVYTKVIYYMDWILDHIKP